MTSERKMLMPVLSKVQVSIRVYWGCLISNKRGGKPIKPKIHCLAKRQQLRINVLLATFNSSAPIWLSSSSCEYHISKQSFSGYFSVPVSLGLKAKVQPGWVRNITISDELYDMWSVPPAAWMGQVGAVSMSGVTQYVTETHFGSVMTSARRACLLYSQRWCEKDETESGWQEREERERRHVDTNAFIHKCTVSWNDGIYILIIWYSLSSCWLISEGWWVGTC